MLKIKLKYVVAMLGIALFSSASAITVIVPNGFYLRAGMNYGHMQVKGIAARPTSLSPTIQAKESKESKNLAGFQVGAGYAFSQLPVRIDIVYTKRNDLKYNVNSALENSSTAIKISSKLKEQDLMANLYYDWHWHYTKWVYPFFFVGIGLVENKTDSSFTGTNYAHSADAKRGSFAWQGGFGFRFRITSNFYADLGLQHAELGEATWGPWTNGTDGPVTLKTSNIGITEATLTFHLFFGSQESQLPPSLIGDDSASKTPSLMGD